jgi:hypothetical protein
LIEVPTETRRMIFHGAARSDGMNNPRSNGVVIYVADTAATVRTPQAA